MKIIPVILSGGAGTRLWPMSRLGYPKQFLSLTSCKLTLLQETAQRISNTTLFIPPIIICNAEHRFIIAEQLRQIGVTDSTIILEPTGRNTAPAITLAALYIKDRYGIDALMLVMPSDHTIKAPNIFIDAVKNALPIAQQGALMTFGIKPSHPETAYGYINYGKTIHKKHYIYAISSFVEKPSTKLAKQYVSSGEYVWNSGIFLFAAGNYLDELGKLEPEIVSLCEKSLSGKRHDLDFIRVDESSFSAVKSISIDNAVMEHTQKGAVIEMDPGWNDLGSWDSLWETQPKDECGNVIVGKAYVVDCNNSYIRNDGVSVSLVGVDNLVVVSTKDAVLVAHKDRVQDIKALVNIIGKDNKDLIENHRCIYRPWGYYESVDDGQRHQVKHLCIKPQQKISVQMHHHRAEHWIIVRGTARVMLDGVESSLSENQSFYIPIGVKHSLENPGKIDLDIIEVQTGSYLGEDDIVRFEDKYGR